jgi:threonine/homoserine/homoserine lactone efflux protein
MAETYPILAALLTGIISGILLSIPVGPVNLTIMNQGAQRGFKWAALIGLGASLMEVIYCALAFTGFAEVFTAGFWKAAMEFVSFAFMLGLGLKFLLIRTVPTVSEEGRFEKKLHPTSAFATGFVRVMANPGVFLFWIVLGVYFIAHEWVKPTLSSKMACVTGVALGTYAWFASLSYAVSLGHRKFSERTLLRMERGSGIGLLGLALIHGVQMLWQMHGK